MQQTANSTQRAADGRRQTEEHTTDLSLKWPTSSARERQFNLSQNIVDGYGYGNGKRQTANGRRKTADSRQQTADSRQQTADGNQLTADGR
jgi:hypothetical protein